MTQYDWQLTDDERDVWYEVIQMISPGEWEVLGDNNTHILKYSWHGYYYYDIGTFYSSKVDAIDAVNSNWRTGNMENLRKNPNWKEYGKIY